MKNSALMAHSRAVQSSTPGVSGCSVPAGTPQGGDTLREKNQTPNHRTCTPLVHRLRIRQSWVAHRRSVELTCGDSIR